MSTLKTEDALVVYRQELGAPVALSYIIISDITKFNFGSGETNSVETASSGSDVNGDGVDSTGIGLELDILLLNGSITNTRIVNAGTGYKENEVLTVSGGTGRVYVTSVGLNGEVISISIRDAGQDYSVEKGFLSPIEAQGGTGSGLMVLPVITGGEIVAFEPGGTDFQPVVNDTSPTDYMVGDELRFEDGPNDIYAYATVAYVNVTGQNQNAGGAFRYEGKQLFDDVQEKIDAKFDTTPADIRLETVDYDPTKLDHRFDGDLKLEIDADPSSVTSVFTFQRPGAVDYVADEYGYNFDGDTNDYDLDSNVSTQAQFNKKIYQKVQFIEDNIYFARSDSDTKLNNESPRLHVDTKVKTLGTYPNTPADEYALIPSETDLQNVKSIADGNFIEINELRTDLENFETGGLIFKGNVDADNQVPPIAETSVGWFWVASEDFTDDFLGDIAEGVMIAVREDGDDDKAFTFVSRTSYDGIFLALSNDSGVSQSVEGYVDFGKAFANDLTIVGDDESTLTTKSYVDNHTSNYLPLSGGTLTGDLEIEDSKFTLTDAGENIVELKATQNNFEKPTNFKSTTSHPTIVLHADGANDATGLEVLHIVPDGFDNTISYRIPDDKLVDIGHHFSSGIKITSQSSTDYEAPGTLLIEGKTLVGDPVAKIRLRGESGTNQEGRINFYENETLEFEALNIKTKAPLSLNADDDLPYLESSVGSVFGQSSISYTGMITDPNHITNKEYVDLLNSDILDSIANLDGFVKKTGDTMSGHLEIRGTAADGVTSRLKCNILDSGQDTNLEIKRNNVTGISVNNGTNTLHQQTKLSSEGTADQHIITKKYVDDKVSEKASSSHSHSYASSGHKHGNTYVKSGSSDSSTQDIRIWKSGSLYYIS